MLLFDVSWISHDGASIFSLDLHPNGNKLATAGQDRGGSGLLVIWDLELINSPMSSDSTSPECNFNPLARIPHTSSINCVRWSKFTNSQRLVCAGDDPVLCIYECTGIYSSMGSIDQQNSSTSTQNMVKRNVETYRCIYKLYGHTLDVMHSDFSPDGKYIASCSLDNTVIIWNALKLPEKLTILKESNGGHTRGVKGLAWDPVGRFLATQAEDNSLKIWQTDNWICVRTFTEPFAESAISTLFYRMDWSSDGCHLVAPCAMNNGGPTAKIFIRNDWSYPRDLVGFRKAVACVRTNPHCFQRINSSGTHSTVSCFAVGSRDRSLSVWLIPNFGRPLLVIEKLFKDSVIDLSWSKLVLAACSRDGVIRILKFSDNEIGHMLSAEERCSIFERLYGFRPQFGPSAGIKLHVVDSISSDFGYTTICDKLLKQGNQAKNASDLFRLAFNMELPKKRISDEMLHQFVQKAKRQRMGEYRRTSFNDSEKSHLAYDQLQDASNQQQQTDESGIRSDLRLYERKEGNIGDTNVDKYAQIFELPERRRLMIVMVTHDTEPKNSTAIDCVEMINNFPLQAHSEPQIARLAAYKSTELKKPTWVFFCHRLVSLLAANRHWTLMATFDGHLLAISTQTGRFIFDICLEEPLAILQLQERDEENNLCLSIGLGGTLSIWDMSRRKRAIHSQIGSLFRYPNHQLISAEVTKLSNGQVTAKLLFSDHSLYVYSPRLNEWVKKHSFLDLLKSAQLPANITSLFYREEEEISTIIS